MLGRLGTTKFWGVVWPILAIIAAVVGALLLPPLNPKASWWPSAAWARNASTGIFVGLIALLIGEILGLVAGTVGLPGGWSFERKESSSADLTDIRTRLADVVEAQRELTATAVEALTLARVTSEQLLAERKQASRRT